MISDYLKKYSYYYLSKYSVTKKKFENILKRKISKDFFQKKISNEKKTQYLTEVPEAIKYFNKYGCFNELNLLEIKLRNLLSKGYPLKKIKYILTNDFFNEDILEKKMNELKKDEYLDYQLMEKYLLKFFKKKNNYKELITKKEFEKILFKFVNEGFNYNKSISFLKEKLMFYDYP